MKIVWSQVFQIRNWTYVSSAVTKNDLILALRTYSNKKNDIAIFILLKYMYHKIKYILFFRTSVCMSMRDKI